MTEQPRPLQILLEEQPRLAPLLSPEVVQAVYLIEERVQFDQDRPEAAPRIRELIQAALATMLGEGVTDGYAS